MAEGLGKPAKPVKVGNWKATPASEFKTFSSTHEADQWGKQHYNDWAKTLSKKERDAVQSYKSSSYAINRYHRDPQSVTPTPEILEETKLLDKALATKPLPEPVTVVRYFGLSDLGVDYTHVKIGMDVIDNGYLSTSVNPDHTWSGQRFEIRLPAGTHAGYAQIATPSHQNEYEIIVGRAANHYRVVELKKDSQKTIVLELVTPNPKKPKATS